MVPQNFKIIQLENCTGIDGGLYVTQRDDIENIQDDFKAAFSNLDVEDIQAEGDSWLRAHKIYRVWDEKPILESLPNF